eukprot:750096-Hanusia_phi.AAC.4
MEKYIPLRLLRKVGKLLCANLRSDLFSSSSSRRSGRLAICMEASCVDHHHQCVEIMSDDQSTLLKRQGVIEVRGAWPGNSRCMTVPPGSNLRVETEAGPTGIYPTSSVPFRAKGVVQQNIMGGRRRGGR